MKIVKRDSRIVEFDINRIVNAIMKAMAETKEGIDERLAKSIAKSIQEDTKDYVSPITVEEVQDLVEVRLMNSNRKDVAKQ